MANFSPFTGSQRGLLMAIDFGTTYSGVAYAVLDPGQIPRIQSVTRFPGQEIGDFKIPSVICYKKDGTIRAVGAEARDCLFDDEEIERDGLEIIEWFKLHICPRNMMPSELSLPPLPLKKAPVDVIADLLAYLFECAHTYIEETHANGKSLWASAQSNLQLVLSHPNGWGGSQQAMMREAALRAKLVPSGTRIHFVTEGEASLHYCINSGLANEIIKVDNTAMIIDCGGGTIDLTTYKFIGVDPVTVEEIASPGSILQGSTQVNVRFHRFLQHKLENSVFEADILDILSRFEKSTKPMFNDPSKRVYIPFNSSSGAKNDIPAGIRNNRLTVEGVDVEAVFQPSVDAILDAIKSQKNEATSDVYDAFLVGGFAESRWLFDRLKTGLKAEGVNLSRPSSGVNKAVSEGSVSFFLRKLVSVRVARITYGIYISALFKEDNIEHRKRAARKYVSADGTVRLSGAFQMFIARGDRLREDSTIRYSFQKVSKDRNALDTFQCGIIAYRGEQAQPYWTDEDPSSYSALCYIHANTPRLCKEVKAGSNRTYYRFDHDIVLKVGLTELKAQAVWKQDGEEKWSDAMVIFYDS